LNNLIWTIKDKKMNEWETINFEQIVERCRLLARELKKNNFTKIVAVTRGGLVPAALLAQFLNIREIGTISLVSYDEKKQNGALKCLHQPNFAIDGQTLFVDDLFDSGNTYRYLKDNYPQAKVAVLYNKNSEAVLDFPAENKRAGVWLIFPWEFEPL